MPDVFTKAKRSEVMSRIRSRGNRDTELALVRLLRANGITGWRRQITLVIRSSQRKEALTSNPKSKIQNPKLNRASPPRLLRVKVDFIFPKSRTALFVDGCFWHGCPRHATQPRNNRAFWQCKLAGNKRRDARVTRTLRRTGWGVIRIWECDLARRPQVCVRRIQRRLAG